MLLWNLRSKATVLVAFGLVVLVVFVAPLATVMVYPATWKTLPVTIFGLTDGGQAFQAAACTTVLLLVTLLALLGLGRIRGRAALR
jgi:2-aminoethylphosphonate transport system permease protein